MKALAIIVLALSTIGFFLIVVLKGISKEKRWKSLVPDLVGFIIPVAVVWILVTQVFALTVVSSGSMEPTLMTGDIVVYNRLAYKFNTVKRGDIITFWSEERDMQMGKRVIGVPGDEIKFIDGHVVINGFYIDERNYLEEGVETNCNKAFTVPDGCYFVMGDNRENSADSRHWENPYISAGDIIGKYIGKIPKP